MRPPEDMAAVIGGKRYSIRTATLVADDAWWDGHNYERRGRNRFLYRTPRGAYFLVALTQWQNERDSLAPVSLDEAVSLYEGDLSNHRVEYEAAFPDVTVEDA